MEKSYVAISAIEELRRIEISDGEIAIGACVTHAELADALVSVPECRALAQAALNSANPAIRQVATIGGNLSTSAFAAADLVPALICLGAETDIETIRGSERVSVERFLEMRTGMEPGWLLRRVIVPRRPISSAHIRLPLRKAGDYPVAIVSMAVALGEGGTVETARIAVGSVEQAARRWPELESAMIGHPLDSHRTAEQAERLSADFVGRDGIDAPGWYRLKVLPSLVRRAAEAAGKPL
jgi:carbon-monoxide dehydrogenase medium subunit